MLTLKKLGMAVAVLAIIAIAAIACGDDDDDASAQDTGSEETQKTQVMAAMIAYRSEGLHEIDDAAQEASEIDPTWKGRVTRMRQLTAGVDWPAEFAEPAATLESELQLTADAIDEEDLGAVKEHIPLAHQAWHEFEEGAFAYIAGEEGGDHEQDDEGEGDHNEDDSSPTGE